MSAPAYDAIVVGAGHNGLVTAAYLAKAGRRVLVLERRDAAGGQLASLRFTDGTDVPALHPAPRLGARVVRELDLGRHGLPTAEPAAAPYVVPLPGGDVLTLASRADDAATLDSIRRLSSRDAARWPEFVTFMHAATRLLDAAYATTMPRLPKIDWRTDGWPLASLALKLRGLGRRDMFRVLRTFSMTGIEVADEWFESEPLRAAIGALGVHGVTLGAMGAGAGFGLVHQWWLRGGLAHRSTPGHADAIRAALVAAIRAAGGEVRTSAAVERILVDRQQVLGVRLASGEEIRAGVVASAADPRHTLLGLVGGPELPPDFTWDVESIRLRGSVAKVHLLTDAGHGLPGGTVCLVPTLLDLERAFDACKYGRMSEAPYLEVTTQGPVVSVHVQYAPYRLRESDWTTLRPTLELRAIDAVAARFPQLERSIREIRSITPQDLEQQFGLSEGDLNHGQPILDQVFFMRPLPGWSDHRTPVDGLYLCGSGGHGGGGISGAPGRNAARAILRS